MSTRIKMIALDMDGTLLNDEKEITPYTKEVLEKAMEEGVVVLACTGRPVTAIPVEFSVLKGVKYAISSNGSRILDVEEDKVLFEQLLDGEDTMKLVSIVEKYDTYREVFWDGRGYSTKQMEEKLSCYLSEPMCNYIRNTRIFVEDLNSLIREKNRGCDKLHIAFADMEERSHAIQEILELGAFELESAMEKSIEITAPGINKGTGIIRLGKILGIEKEEIMAVGDGMNDVSMLREVGFPVAMSNGVEEVKGLAKYITESNNEDGVAKAIEKFVLC